MKIKKIEDLENGDILFYHYEKWEWKGIVYKIAKENFYFYIYWSNYSLGNHFIVWTKSGPNKNPGLQDLEVWGCA